MIAAGLFSVVLLATHATKGESARTVVHASTTERRNGEAIAANDNRTPAGRLVDGVLTVRLEARSGTWFPEGPKGRGLEVAAFAEVGKPLQNPGPLIRVPAGTRVETSIKNSLSKPLTVYGFGATRGMSDSVVIAPGTERSVAFVAASPGTFYYTAKLGPYPIFQRMTEDTQLNGAIVIDSPGPARARPDRVFLMSWWLTLDSTSKTGMGRGTMAINGLSWPHTEHLEMTQGDSAHWRVLNLTAADHPMHLHGFYFRVNAVGDGVRDSSFAPVQQRMAVTEAVLPFQTVALSWTPKRPGNWIFHCHYAGHLSKLSSLDTDKGEHDEHSLMQHGSDRPHEMFGLVLGISVKPNGTVAAETRAARPIRLIVRDKPNVYGHHPGYAFVIGGSREDSSGALPVPGPVLVLEKGLPVAITIVNRSTDHSAVHWHGIELDSYPDGVPGWSGAGKQILPSIPPGDSLTVRFTPPRAGTFMYHSHFNEASQISSGLYGAIVVLEPGQKYDPATDRLLIFGLGGPTVNVMAGPFAPVTLNGQVSPDPIEMTAGTRYRLRLINIADDLPIDVSLRDGRDTVQWRAVAKDGMVLPASQSTVRKAALRFTPGEIYDFEFTPASTKSMTLVFGQAPVFIPTTPIEVAVRVR